MKNNFIHLIHQADITFNNLHLTINVSVSSPNTATPGYSLTTTNNGINGTCPFIVNYFPDTSANGGIPATVANITAGLYIAKIPSTTYVGVNLSQAGFNHPMPACQCHYSQITIQPEYLENI